MFLIVVHQPVVQFKYCPQNLEDYKHMGYWKGDKGHQGSKLQHHCYKCLRMNIFVQPNLDAMGDHLLIVYVFMFQIHGLMG
jgi:hypothetical protein